MKYHLPLRQVYYGIGYLQYVDCLTLKYFVLHFCHQKIHARIFTGFLTFFGAVFEGKCQTQVSMKMDGDPLEKIIRNTGLSFAEIEKL